MSNIYIVLDDLKEKFNHEFIYDIYDQWKNYQYIGLFCKKCKYKLQIFLAKNGYLFDKQLNFPHVININGLEYAYDEDLLTCEEYIIKTIIE